MSHRSECCRKFLSSVLFLFVFWPLSTQAQEKIKIAYSSTDTLKQKFAIRQSNPELDVTKPNLKELYQMASPLAEMQVSDAALATRLYGGYATAIFVAGWATGGLIFGAIGDRIGRARTLTFAILIVIAAFLPLMALQGVEGRLFIPLALSIIFSMLGSLLMAFVVSPALCLLLLGARRRI